MEAIVRKAHTPLEEFQAFPRKLSVVNLNSTSFQNVLKMFTDSRERGHGFTKFQNLFNLYYIR